jgi:hypothetical protein
VTLIELSDLLQGSDAWLEQRRGIVTASVVGKLLTTTGRVASNDYSRALTTLLVAERITGWTDPVYVTDAMLRGQEDEPRARRGLQPALRAGHDDGVHGAARAHLDARLLAGWAGWR